MINTEAIGPEEIRSAFAFAIDTVDQFAVNVDGVTMSTMSTGETVAGMSQALAAAADRYEQLSMAPSSVVALRDATEAVTTSATRLGEAGESMRSAHVELLRAVEHLSGALADFNARDGMVADAVADAGNLASDEILTS